MTTRERFEKFFRPDGEGCWEWTGSCAIARGGYHAPRRFFGEKHWREPLRWNVAAEAAGERRRVFCASMADVLEDRAELDLWRAKLWDLIDRTPWLDWLLLSKRPQRFGIVPPEILARIWAGTTAENDEWAQVRVRELIDKARGACVRFISAEPLLGALDAEPFLFPECEGCGELKIGFEGEWSCRRPGCEGEPWTTEIRVDWIIVGGESGPKYREMRLDYLRSLATQCRMANVPLFVKQDSGPRPGEWGRIPPELRIQEFPRP